MDAKALNIIEDNAGDLLWRFGSNKKGLLRLIRQGFPNMLETEKEKLRRQWKPLPTLNKENTQTIVLRESIADWGSHTHGTL